MQLFDDEAGDPAVAKSTTHGGSPVEPAGDGVPGQPFDPGDRGQADALDSQRDRVERRSAVLETVIGRAFRRRERLSAADASVSTAFSGRGSVESVADDTFGLDVSVQRGVVYTATDPRLDRRVAIKLLPPDLTRDEIAKQRFLQEAKAASALDHPNICTIHEINETDDGQLYLVMAHYEGETLKERIGRGPMVTADGTVKILDFGPPRRMGDWIGLSLCAMHVAPEDQPQAVPPQFPPGPVCGRWRYGHGLPKVRVLIRHPFAVLTKVSSKYPCPATTAGRDVTSIVVK